MYLCSLKKLVKYKSVAQWAQNNKVLFANVFSHGPLSGSDFSMHNCLVDDITIRIDFSHYVLQLHMFILCE